MASWGLFCAKQSRPFLILDWMWCLLSGGILKWLTILVFHDIVDHIFIDCLVAIYKNVPFKSRRSLGDISKEVIGSQILVLYHSVYSRGDRNE